MAQNLIAWIPEVQLCTTLLVLLFYGTGPASSVVAEAWWLPRRLHTTKGSFLPETFLPSRAEGGASLSTAHLCVWAALWCFLGALLVYWTPLPALQIGGVFLRDSFSTNMCALLLFYASFAILIATDWYSSAKVIYTEYASLVCLSIFGMHLLLCATDLKSLYLCLELQSFALIVLCSLNHKSAYAVEAGIKYFLLSAFSSCLLLLGVGLVYWDTGCTQISHLHELYLLSVDGVSLSSTLGLWLISLGLLWKLSAAPLHFWAADVYAGAWSSVTLLISTLPKIAVLGFWVHHWHPLWTTVFGKTLFWFSAASLLIGALAPFAQVQLKRLLAFSSIGHMGFMFMPLVGSSEGYTSLWVYLAFYCITSLVTWGLILWPFHRQTSHSAFSLHQNVGTSTGPQYLWDLTGLNTAMPAAAIAWAVGMLSLAGLPPAAGFLGKLGLFWWGLNAHQYALVILALASTLLSSVYYLRVLLVSYVENTPRWGMFTPFSSLAAYIVSVSTMSLLVLLWYCSPLILSAHLLSLSSSLL